MLDGNGNPAFVAGDYVVIAAVFVATLLVLALAATLSRPPP